jgi:hypothetical protein
MFNLYYVENVVGEQSTVKGELVTQVLPLQFEDTYDSIKQDGGFGFVKNGSGDFRRRREHLPEK